MRSKQLAFLFILVAAVAVASVAYADESSVKSKAPEGWKWTTAKDGSYEFLFPTDTKSSGERQRTFKRGGLAGRSQVNYCVLKDDTALAIAATNLSGSAVKGLKIGDVYNIMIDADKEGGAEVSNLKAREYTVVKGPNVQRKVLLVVKGRVYELSAGGPDKEKATSAAADTFLKSLTIVQKSPPSKESSTESTGETLPATPAPKAWKNKPPADAAYRPTFKYADGKEESAGTAFVVQSPSSKKLALTAAHVMDRKEWDALRSTTLSSMSGKKVIDLPGKPMYVGREFDQLAMLRKGPVPIFNTSEDFAIWLVPETADVTVLALADHEPKVNEWVWIAGQQPGKPLLFYRSKVTQVLNGTMVMDQYDRFDPQGFSGAPVITAESKVIGTMLAGDPKGNMRQGATVGNIRRRIKDL